MAQPDRPSPSPSSMNDPSPSSATPSGEQEAALAGLLSLFSGAPSPTPAPSPGNPNSELDINPDDETTHSDHQPSAPNSRPTADPMSYQHPDEDVSVLQDILLGPTLVEYRDRISNIEEEMILLKQNVNEVSAVIQEFAPALQSMLEDQFNRMEKSLLDAIHGAIAPLSEEVQSLKKHMGQEQFFSIQVSAISDET